MKAIIKVVDSRIEVINPLTSKNTPEEKLERYRKSVADAWDGCARDYDLMVAEANYVGPKTLANLISPFLVSGQEALDLGAGTGMLGAELIPKGITVDGIDFSIEMLKRSKERGYRKTVCLDVTQKNRFQGSYDCIVSCGMFGDVVDPENLVQFLELLKTRGVVGIAGRCEPFGLNPDVLLERLVGNGLEIKVTQKSAGHLFSNTGEPAIYFYVVATR